MRSYCIDLEVQFFCGWLRCAGIGRDVPGTKMRLSAEDFW